MVDYELDDKTWKELETRIVATAKTIDPDPNITDSAIWIHNVPPEEAKTNEENNFYSRIKTIIGEPSYHNGVELRSGVDNMKSTIGKELMSIEIKRIKK